MIELRPGTQADAEWITDLEIDLFGLDAWSPDQLSDELCSDTRRWWVLPQEGYAEIMLSGDVADLLRIGVRDSAQRAGAGRRLLDAAIVSAYEGGANRMLLEVSATNTRALGVYAAAGFTEIDRRARYYRDGSDAVVMRLGLRAGCGGRVTI